MRIIIAGSRSATNNQVYEAIAKCDWSSFVSCIISGGAKGADEQGETLAREFGIDIKIFPADWNRFGKRAGPLRNKQMSENADGLIAVWDGTSPGTANMIKLAQEAGLKICIFRTDSNAMINKEPKGDCSSRWEEAQERAAILEFSGGMTRRDAERRAGKQTLDSCLNRGISD